MFLCAEQPKSLDDNTDEGYDDSVSVETNPTIIFPYTGPPGAGPGLLGSRPGADKLDYLIQLEHFASSLKCALSVAADLKNARNKESSVNLVYNSISDIQNGVFQNGTLQYK